MTNKEKILKKYYKSINELTDLFISTYFPDFDKSDYYWIADNIGGVLHCGDYFFDLKTIQNIVELDLTDGELDKWIDYESGLCDLLVNKVDLDKKINNIGVKNFIKLIRSNISDDMLKKAFSYGVDYKVNVDYEIKK